ncbi:putative RNA-directed DNA polymerase from transposon BS [Trichonephila clavipes]|uniref:Putative RNA-directed DNA polymerase from transposon BS n=1 Tax=Trichonephila clavipes TaxID=2585209 RepID=A0A8X6W1Z8_TRICX|nr:putative RNA-directed DNA polymerase from transposon BS [Trichonephila clavipes]
MHTVKRYKWGSGTNVSLTTGHVWGRSHSMVSKVKEGECVSTFVCGRNTNECFPSVKVRGHLRLLQYGLRGTATWGISVATGICPERTNWEPILGTKTDGARCRHMTLAKPHSLSFTGAGLELNGIYFHDQFLTSVTKSSELTRVLRALVNQLALETINGIPQSSLKIYTDMSRGEKGISGSGVYIPTLSGASKFKIKNPNYCSVFRSELIAIRRGLQCAAQLEDRFQEIWNFTDSRASIQHLANWGDIGDQTSLDILSLLHDLSSGHIIHFQWIPSPVGIDGNERADLLARTAAVEGVSPRGTLTFSEISTISNLELNRLIKTPPSHAWYFAK